MFHGEAVRYLVRGGQVFQNALAQRLFFFIKKMKRVFPACLMAVITCAPSALWSDPDASLPENAITSQFPPLR